MSNESEKLHDEKWSAIHALNSIGWALKELSDSFVHTGNEKIGQDLHLMSVDLRKAVETITGSDAKIAHIEAQQAEQSTANMMRAAFAGILKVTKGDSADEG